VHVHPYVTADLIAVDISVMCSTTLSVLCWLFYCWGFMQLTESADEKR